MTSSATAWRDAVVFWIFLVFSPADFPRPDAKREGFLGVKCTLGRAGSVSAETLLGLSAEEQEKLQKHVSLSADTLSSRQKQRHKKRNLVQPNARKPRGLLERASLSNAVVNRNCTHIKA